MPAEILIQINSEFDDKGLKQASQQLQALIDGAMGSANKGGKKTNSIEQGLKEAIRPAEQLADTLKSLEPITKGVNNLVDALEGTLDDAAESSKKITAHQEKNNQLVKEHAALLTRAKAASRELAKDAERRQQAEEELRDITKEVQALEQRRQAVSERMNQIAAKGTADSVEKKKVQEELNALQREATTLANQHAAAQKKIDATKGARENAQKLRDELKYLTQQHGLTTGPIVGELDKLDVALGNVAKNAGSKANVFKSVFRTIEEDGKKIKKEFIELEQVYNRFGNTNLGSLSTRGGAHLDGLINKLRGTRSQWDGLGEDMKRSNDIAKQHTHQIEQATAAQKEYLSVLKQTNAQVGGDVGGAGYIKPTNLNALKNQQQLLEKATRNLLNPMTQKLGNAMMHPLATMANQFNKAAQGAQAFGRVMSGLHSILARLATAIGNTLVNALQRANAALGNFTSSGSRFAMLRSNLDATGRSFDRFGDRVDRSMARANTTMERTAAGWSLMMSGQQMTQMGQTMFRNSQQAFGSYLDFERASTLAAVSTVNPNPDESPWLGNRSPSRYIQELVFGAQRGAFGAPIRNLSSEEVAQGIYYYGSAIGQDINPENAKTVMQTLTPMLQLSGFTQTAPETTIKGVLNAAQQFGIDPRDIGNTGDVQRIADIYGWLANETSMEVPDISNFFKMVGPLAGILSPAASSTDALNEVLTWMYIASDYGLRGSAPARGLQQMMQTLISPSGPANDAFKNMFGMDIRDKFFDEKTGTLKGGLRGVIEPFLGLSDGEWITLQADMFTNNASRAIIPLIEEMRNDPRGLERWDELLKDVEDGKFLGRGFEVADDTFAARLQDMKNAWTQFTAALSFSIEPEAFAFLGTLSGGLRELADIVFTLPELGKVFAGLWAGIGTGLAVGGGILSFAGALLVLQRAFMIAGQGATVFFTVLRALPLVLGMALPALALVAAAFVALKTAYDNNFLGMADGINGLRKLFSGDFSNTFFQFLGSDRFAAIYTNIMNVKDAFTELVSGIMFNTGDTNNLFALMTQMFGPRVGAMINYGLDTLRGKLSDVRTSIKDFFSGVSDGLPSLGTFARALLGVGEAILTGGFSGFTYGALMDIGEWLGIDGLDRKVSKVARNINSALETITGYAKAFGTIMGDIFSQIGDNLASIFTADNLMAALGVALQFVSGVALGVASAFGTMAFAIATVVQIVTSAIANLGGIGTALNDVIQNITGFRVELDNLGTMVGYVFGSLFAGKILAAITPIRMIQQSVIGLIATLGLLGARAGLVGAQFAVMGAQFAALKGMQAIFTGLSVSVMMLGANAAKAGTGLATAAKIFGGLQIASLGLVGVLGFVAVGIYAVVAATQGLDRANALARAFFEGFKTGVMILAGALKVVVSTITSFVQFLASILQYVPIVGGVFRDAETAAKALGVAMTAITAIAVVGVFGHWASSIRQFVLQTTVGNTALRTFRRELVATAAAGNATGGWRGFLNMLKNIPTALMGIPQAATAARVGLMGLIVLGTTGMFQPLITGLGDVIDKLLGVSSAGLTAGKVVSSALGGALQGALAGGMIGGVPGAILGGLLGGGAGIFKAHRDDNQRQEVEAMQRVRSQIGLDLGSDVKMIDTVDIMGSVVNSPHFASFEGANPLTGKWGKYTVDLRNDNVYDYGQYLDPSKSVADLQRSNWGTPDNVLEKYNKSIQDWEQKYFKDVMATWGSSWANEYANMSQAEQDALRKQGVNNADQYANKRYWDSAAYEKQRHDEQWLAENPDYFIPVAQNVAEPNYEHAPSLVQMPVDSSLAAQAQGPIPTVLGQGTPMTAAQRQNRLTSSLFGQDSIGQNLARTMGLQPTELAAMLGFSPESGWSLDNIDKVAMSKYANKKFDPRQLDFLPQEYKAWLEGQSDWYDFQAFADEHFGGDTNMAANHYAGRTGKKPPTKPVSFAESMGMSEDDANAYVQMEQEEYAKMVEHEAELQQAWLDADLLTSMRANMSGPAWVTDQGHFGRSVSGAEAIVAWSDQLLSNFGDSMPWMNTTEMLADAGIHGLLTQNMGGRNMHKALMPALEQWARESGIPVADLLKDIPKFYYDEAYMAQATTDMAQFFAGTNRNDLKKLDTLGAGVYEDYGLNWEELSQYAIGQAMQGNTDWNLADYISQAWDMSIADAEAYIAANGLDPNVVNGSLFADTQGMIDTQGGQVVALTEQWWDYLNDVTEGGTDKMIEISRSAFEALPDYVKTAYTQMGYQFVIGGEENAAQVAANAQMIMDRLSMVHGEEAFASINAALEDGTATVTKWTDELGNQWVTLQDTLGNEIVVSELEYDAWMRSARDLELQADGLLEKWIALKNLMIESTGPSHSYDKGSGGYNADPDFGYYDTDGVFHPIAQGDKRRFTMPTNNYQTGFEDTIGYNTPGGAPALIGYAQSPAGQTSAVDSTLAQLGLPSLEQLESGGAEAWAAWSSGFTTGAEGGGEGTRIDVKELIKIDDAAISAEGQKVGQEIRKAIETGLSEAFGSGGRPAGGMSSDFENGMVTSFGGSDSSPLAQSLVKSIIEPLKQELATTLPQEINTALSEAMTAVAGMIGAQTMTSGIVGALGFSSGNLGIGTALGQSLAESIAQGVSQSLSEQLPAKINEAIQSAMSGISLGGGSGSGGGAGSVIASALGGLGGALGGGGGAGLTITVQIDGDTTPLMAKIGEAKLIGDGFTTNTYKAQLDGDTVPLATSIGNAKIMGDAFATNIFKAQLDGDPQPFLDAKNAANIAGTEFANTTFTASIGANADPFWAVVNSISGSVVGTATIQVRAAVTGLSGILEGFRADGGPINTAGLYMVGERGPEIVHLPKGAHVYDNPDSMRMLTQYGSSLQNRPSITSGVSPSQSQSFSMKVEQTVTHRGQSEGPNTVEINFNGPVYARDDEEIKRMSKQVADEVKRGIARDNQLAERGMVAHTIGRPLG